MEKNVLKEIVYSNSIEKDIKKTKDGHGLVGRKQIKK